MFFTTITIFLTSRWFRILYEYPAKEDADVLIVQVAVQLAQSTNNNVLIIGQENDLLVLMLHFVHKEGINTIYDAKSLKIKD
uniref:Uncharacterized protein n=1 Tax=Trichogramma kaykai TaxID=54128 RepID=A0ABD2W7G1_9HYME